MISADAARGWLLVATFSALISVGVESVQERDVSSVVLVVVALGALAGFVRASGRRPG